MGLRDVLFGRKKLAEPSDDRLFSLTTAAVTLQTELGLKTA
ncbi:MAG: PspA-associated protein PspAB, partial [Gaiellaceae bacterium]